MSKKIKNYIKISISLILVGWLIFSVNWKEVFGYLIGVNFYLIFLFIILYISGIVISAYKWKLLAEYKNFSKPFSFYFKTYILGIFFNNFFPSFVGGDAYRVIALGKNGKDDYHSSASSVVFDRVSGFFGAIFAGLFFGFLNFSVMEKNPVWEWFVFCSVLILIISFGATYFWPTRFMRKIINFFPRIISKHLEELAEYRNWKIFFQAMAATAFFAFVALAAANYALFLAVGVKISLLDYLSVIFFISIISSIPISVGNIGVKEWAYIFSFGIFGVSESVAVAVVILSRVIQLLVSLIALPIYLKERK
jgi:hypothetical protein